MASNPAYLHYASDFMVLTGGWDPIEVCTYMRLRASQWVNGYLVNDQDRLARISGVKIEDFKKAWVIVGLEFALCDDGFLRDPALERLRAEREVFLKRQSENGKKGGRPKKNTQEKPTENPPLSFGLTQNITQKKPLEDEDENRDEDESKSGIGLNNFPREKFLIPRMQAAYLESVPGYAADDEYDYGPLGEISRFICGQEKIRADPATDQQAQDTVLLIWQGLCKTIGSDKFFKNQSLKTISTHIQTIVQKFKNGKDQSFTSGEDAGYSDAESLYRAIVGDNYVR